MLLLALALIAAQQPALEAAEKAAGKSKDQGPSKQVQQLVQSCDAHKFETVIEMTGPDGQPRHSRMKLCGTEGQSDADWIRTLKDAVAKTSANEAMPRPVRDQIIAAVNAEIARLEGRPAPAKIAALPPPRAATTASSTLEDYGALPPLPNNPPPPVHVLAGGSAELPLLPRPKMSFACFTPGDQGEGPCTDFTRETFLTVRADEDVPPGTSLRFMRNGQEGPEVELAQLKRGRSMRFALPADVCRGFTNGKLDIRIVRSVAAAGPGGQEVGEEGPYVLRC